MKNAVKSFNSWLDQAEEKICKFENRLQKWKRKNEDYVQYVQETIKKANAHIMGIDGGKKEKGTES